MSIEEIETKKSYKLLLEADIEKFFKYKQELDKYKKSTDEMNKEIKKFMKELDLEEFITYNGFKAKVTTSKRESLNESAVIDKLKELNITAPIKTVEVIDYTALEDAIYNGKLDASILSEYKEIKEVVTLKVTESKKEKGE